MGLRSFFCLRDTLKSVNCFKNFENTTKVELKRALRHIKIPPLNRFLYLLANKLVFSAYILVLTHLILQTHQTQLRKKTRRKMSRVQSETFLPTHTKTKMSAKNIYVFNFRQHCHVQSTPNNCFSTPARSL